jgi:hypothetical protein
MIDFVVVLSIGNILVSENTKKRLGKKALLSRALGAVTTRHVSASNPDDAFEVAKKSAEDELRNSDLAPILNGSSSPLSFDLEEVRENLSGGELPRSGFTFFLEPTAH